MQYYSLPSTQVGSRAVLQLTIQLGSSKVLQLTTQVGSGTVLQLTTLVGSSTVVQFTLYSGLSYVGNFISALLDKDNIKQHKYLGKPQKKKKFIS